MMKRGTAQVQKYCKEEVAVLVCINQKCGGADPCENKAGMNKQVIWNGDLRHLARRTVFFLPCSMCCTDFPSSKKKKKMQYCFMSSCPTHIPS